MGSISLTFTGMTMEEVVRLVVAWTPPASGASRVSDMTSSPTADVDLVDAIGRVIEGVHGKKSRRLVRHLAEVGLRGEVVKLSESLIREFGVASGTAFAGMIGPVNRRAARIIGRPLVDYPSADPNARIWRIVPDDARAVLDALRD